MEIRDYEHIIKTINEGIEEFIGYLNIDKVNFKNLAHCAEEKSYLNLRVLGWKQLSFPNSNKAGIYFIFGRSETESGLKTGVYIGKASHSSFIGARLYAHLYRAWREEGKYEYPDKSGNIFLLEFVTSIGLKDNLYFLAPALEEYLIYHLKKNDNIALLNYIGS